MSRATPRMRQLAKRLIACEASGHGTSAPGQRAAFSVCDKLRPSLAALAGTTGFRALLLRALALAAIEVPWLQVAHVSAEGTLECPVEPAGEVDSRQFAEGGVVLIAQLLGLLVAFIGEDLTLRLACDVWPKLSRDGFRTGNRRGR